MRLTKLDIKGFKSFGEKITIHFDPGVTAIVGPNGCGKSNVVDAIRWALGEQKASVLRSEKMENVIFNGTKTRRPLQYAEVSLTFLNDRGALPSAYTEVNVLRRYFRTAESEYLLNNVQCRLKDVTDLFMDTGIGPDSYAIIELKMVESILNDREAARRQLFEEAAGISKYKMRKKQSVKKLEEAQADLARVDDLLFELEKQMRDLEKQAKKAEKYLLLKEEYNRTALQLASAIAASLLDNRANIETEIKNIEDQNITIVRQIAETENLIEAVKNKIAPQEQLLRSRDKTRQTKQEQIRQYESNKRLKNERLKLLDEQRKKNNENIDKDTKAIEGIVRRIYEFEIKANNAQTVTAQAEADLNQATKTLEQHRMSADKTNQELNIANTDLRDKQEALHALERQLDVLQLKQDAITQQINHSENDNKTKNESIREFELRMLNLNAELDLAQNQYNQQKQKHQELTANIDEQRRITDQRREKLSTLKQELQKYQTEYNLTKAMADRMEGYPEAVRFLRKNAKWSGEPALLSDLITANEEYRTAIETYLEPLLNYYVVQNYTEAQAGANLLRDSSQGRASFFILDQLENHNLPNTTPVQGLVSAIDIAEFSPKYKPLFYHLLHNVYIAKADYTSQQSIKGCTIIDQKGSVITDISLSGGSAGLFDGKKIGRAKNLEKLQNKTEELKSEITNIETDLATNNAELNRLQTELRLLNPDAALKRLTTVQNDLLKIKTMHEQFTESLKNQTNKHDDLKTALEKIKSEIEHLSPQVAKAKSQKSDAEHHLNQVKEAQRKQASEANQAQITYNKLNTALLEAKNNQQAIKRETEYLISSKNNIEKRLEQAKTDRKTLDKQIDDLLNENDISDDELTALYQELQSIEKGVAEVEQSIFEQKEQIEQLEKQVRDFRRKKDELSNKLSEFRNKQSELNTELSVVTERLKLELGLELSTALNIEIPDGVTQAQLKNESDEIKQKIDKLGPINHMAIETYREIEERASFIKKEKLDLENARQGLNDTIEAIEAEAKRSFLETFEAVRLHFINVFRSLFTEEDTCDLVLVQPDNPLESAIDIIARPKGKRPQTINQLSGGEKTLTATALLFSLYLIKPAPFCIFDEVDAPLDDANIDKFNKLIRKFSHNSQFIIVTHNKRTMAAADVMYGVTMAEEGVSKVLPVDLRKLSA